MVVNQVFIDILLVRKVKRMTILKSLIPRIDQIQ